MEPSCPLWLTWFLFGVELRDTFWNVCKFCKIEQQELLPKWAGSPPPGSCWTSASGSASTSWCSSTACFRSTRFWRLGPLSTSASTYTLNILIQQDKQLMEDSGTWEAILADRAHTTQNSFFGCSPRMYNSIPAELRAAPTLPTFKKKLTLWVKENGPIEWTEMKYHQPCF